MIGTIACLVALVLGWSSVAPAAKPAAACPPARYTVVGEPLGNAGTRSPTIEIGERVGLGPLCALSEAGRVQIARHGVTSVRQRWDACVGLRGTVRVQARVLPDISATKFETVRGMGRGFGYNRNETDADLESADGLIRLLVDVVSKNGNLLLNVGPMADGTVPAGQVARLRAIGAWLGVNGAAIFGTRPWTRPAGVTADGTPVRFTASRDRLTVYATVLGALPAGSVTLVDVGAPPAEVHLLGTAAALAWTATGNDLRVMVPPNPPPQAAYVFALASCKSGRGRRRSVPSCPSS